MADYLLAAHINVTGGAEAAAQFGQMAIQINNFGAAAAKANTGNLGSGMAEATKQASFLDQALHQVSTAIVRMGTYSALFAGWSFLKDGVDAFVDFDAAMTESLAIQTDVTEQMRGRMEDMAKSIAIEFGEAPKEVAEGFYFMASAGLNAEQQIATLPATMQFAKAGMMDLEKATEQLFDALSAVGQKSDDPQQLSKNLQNMADVLTTAAVRSQATVEQMGYAITTKAGAAIKGFNLDLNESVGVLEVFANQGIKGRTAGERFSMLIRDMAMKSQKFGEEWQAMGVQVFDSSGQFNSLITIFEQLDAALLPLSGEERITALMKLGFTMRDVNTVMGILGTSGTLKGFVEELDQAGGTAERIAKNQMESLRAKMQQLSAAFQVGAIEGFEELMEFGDWLGSTFAPAIDKVSPALGSLGRGAGDVFAGLGSAIGAVAAGSLEGLATAIEKIGTFASQHQGAVQALGFALGSLAAAKAMEGVAGLAAALGGPLLAKAVDLSTSFRVIGLEMATIVKNGGSMTSALGSGLTSLASMINPVTIALAAVAATAGVFWMDMRNDAAEAKANMNALATEIASSLGMSTGEAGIAMANLREELDLGTGSLSRQAQAAQEAMTHQTALKLSAAGLSDVYGDLGVKGSEVTNALATGTDIFGEWAEGLANGRTTMSAMREQAEQLPPAVQGIATALLDARSSGQISEVEFIKIARAFDDIADSSDDLTENFQKVARETLTAAMAAGDIGPEFLAASGIMDIQTASAEQLADALERLQRLQDNPAAHNRMGEAAREGMKGVEDAARIADEAAAALERFQKAMEELAGPATEMEAVARMNQTMLELVAATQGYVAESGPLDSAFTSNTEAANKLQITYASATQDALKFASGLADKGKFDDARAYLVAHRDQIISTMQSLGATQPVIDLVISSLGLTDAALNSLNGKEAAVKVTDNGTAAATAAAVTAAAPPSLETQVNMFAQPEGVATTGMTLDETARAREAAAIMMADLAAVGSVEAVFNDAARTRESPAFQQPENQGFVDAEFNSSARMRSSQANQFGTGWPTVASLFDSSAGYRTSQATQVGSGWEGVNAMFDYAARNRTSYVDIVTTYTSINVPGPGGAANIATAAEGGIIHAYAPGGFENHYAQIGKRGVTRMWNEPETGGEAYIPLAHSKRDRSLRIWEETGRRLGAHSGGTHMAVNVPVNVAIEGATDPNATARAVAGQIEAGIGKAMQRVLIELRSA